MKKIMLSLAMALVSVCASAQVYIGGTAGISSNKIGGGDSKTACAPFFICKRTRFYSSLFTFPSEAPVFIGIPRGEEFAATLHPLFTTLHRFQRPTGVNCSARPLGVPEEGVS